jgi:hypothetical protein
MAIITTPRESYGRLFFLDNTIESTSGDIDIQIGLANSSASLLFNRNVHLAKGKTLTLQDHNTPYGNVALSMVNGVLVVGAGGLGMRVGDIELYQDTIESTAGGTNFRLGNPISTANLVIGRNTVLASGKTLTVNNYPVTTTNKNTFNPQFTDASSTFAIGGGSITGNYVVQGPICHFRINVQFSATTTYGTGQYQFTLPFPAVATTSVRGGTLHMTTGTGAPSKFHIAGIVDTADSTSVMKLYYFSTTTDLDWKYNTPNAGYWASSGSQNAHFDLTGSYHIA